MSPEIELKLPPIITKSAIARPSSRNTQTSHSGKKVKEANKIPARKSLSGVKIRANSPKLAVSKRIGQKSAQRKNLSESFAIVKSSYDPQRDIMESMMEMIVENKIRDSKDLEELLACYLSLNSDEQFWIDKKRQKLQQPDNILLFKSKPEKMKWPESRRRR